MNPSNTRRSSWRTMLWALTVLGLGCGSAGDPAEAPREEGPREPRLGVTPNDLALFDFCAEPSTSVEGGQTSVLQLDEGATVMLGTCGITDGVAGGDTRLALHAPDGRLVATSDDGASPGCGVGSRLGFTATVTGTYRVSVACSGATPCCGTVAIARRRALVPYTAMNTNNATLNTFSKQFKFEAGDVVRVSTCSAGAFSASATGDTYLRLFQQTAGRFTEVAASDDAAECGSASELLYAIPTSGYYQVRAGCRDNRSCGGSVAIYVE